MPTPERKGRPPSDWKDRFIAALAEYPNVTAAARAARVTRTHAYDARATDDGFRASWDEALAVSVDDLEAEAMRRAKESSDSLMVFLLRAHRPEKYGDKIKQEITGANDQPFFPPQITVQFVSAPAGSLALDRDPNRRAIEAEFREDG